MLTPQERWELCMQQIKAELSPDEYQDIFADLKLYDFNEDKIRVIVPSREAFQRLQEHAKCARLFVHAVRQVFGENTQLGFHLPSEPKPERPTPSQVKPVPNMVQQKQLPPIEPQLNKHYTFDNFVSGESNKLARSVGLAIAKNPGQTTFNPFFIYGPSGVGKTHLANAIGLKILETMPEKRVLFVSANVFKTQFTEAANKSNLNNFMHFYLSIDVLIIDDVQEISTPKTQQTFFHIFNHLQQNDCQIIMTCDRPPVQLEGMEDRMLTRFKWGMIAEMEKPDVTLRKAILEAKIKRNGLSKFPKDVILYIAENVESSVRELEGILNSIMAYSIVDSEDISLDMVQRIIARAVVLEKRTVTFDELLQKVAEKYKVSVRELYSKSRKFALVQSRQLAMYMVHKYTNLSYAEIGRRFGGRDHTTVIHACTKISNKISAVVEYRREIEEFEASLKK
ncbi:MAG: chromosomal replication initiator protein DnaA [Bacteroidaceae bacterium]|jgi:chromosomal replication initiator protein|nr:chromosomal replication initiator protein DnaA [Bacteroidaceae bacterium]